MIKHLSLYYCRMYYSEKSSEVAPRGSLRLKWNLFLSHIISYYHFFLSPSQGELMSFSPK